MLWSFAWLSVLPAQAAVHDASCDTLCEVRRELALGQPGFLARSNSLLKQEVQEHPKRAETYFLLSRLVQNEIAAQVRPIQDAFYALKLAQLAFDFCPENPEFRYELASFAPLAETKNIQNLLKETQELYPTHPYTWRARSYEHASNDPRLAWEDMQNAYQAGLSPRDSAPWVLSILRQAYQGEDYFEQIKTIASKYNEALFWYELGALALKKQDHILAKQSFQKSFQLGYKTESLFQLAVIDYEEKLFLQSFERLKELDGMLKDEDPVSLPPVYAYLALIEAQDHKNQEALHHASLMISWAREQAPQYVSFLMQAWAQQPDLLKPLLLTLKEYAPFSPIPYWGLAQLSHSDKDDVLALEYLDALAALAPQDESSYSLRAEVTRALGLPELARIP